MILSIALDEAQLNADRCASVPSFVKDTVKTTALFNGVLFDLVNERCARSVTMG
jgi:hypothetical protein